VSNVSKSPTEKASKDAAIEPQVTSPSAHEAEETVRAIYQGAVDAVVVHGRNGPQIVTLSGAEEPYRVLVDRMSDGALTVGADGTVLFVNQRLAEMTGREIAQIVGQPFAALFSDDVPQSFRQWSQPAQAGQRDEANLARADELPLPVSVWAGPLELGDVPATLVTVTDLSVQRRAEQIAAAERFARSILEQATDAIVVLDPRGRITHASWAAEQLSSGSPIDRTFSDVFAVEAADPAQAGVLERSSANMFDAMLATRPFHGLEVRLRGNRKGATFLLSAGPLLDDAKQSVGSIVTLTDITARKHAEEQQTILVAELNHRVKNILAIVQSIATQTVRNSGSLPAFQETFGGRLRALSVAHDVLTKTRWGGVELTQLLREILAPYRDRVALNGPPLLLPSQSAVPLSMALHELMTNAAKYGALSATGRVDLDWNRVEEPGASSVTMKWNEREGPPVKNTVAKGFGTTLIDRVLTYDLEGGSELDFRPEGLQCTLRFPIDTGRAPVEEPPPSARVMSDRG
jgi:PAS domain S-box-containing protein